MPAHPTGELVAQYGRVSHARRERRRDAPRIGAGGRTAGVVPSAQPAAGRSRGTVLPVGHGRPRVRRQRHRPRVGAGAGAREWCRRKGVRHPIAFPRACIRPLRNMLGPGVRGHCGRSRLDEPTAGSMESPLTQPVERPLYIGGSTVKLTLERELWEALDDICAREKVTAEHVVSALSDRWEAELIMSQLWMFAVSYFREAVAGRDPDVGDGDVGGTLLQKVLANARAA